MEQNIQFFPNMIASNKGKNQLVSGEIYFCCSGTALKPMEHPHGQGNVRHISVLTAVLHYYALVAWSKIKSSTKKKNLEPKVPNL